MASADTVTWRCLIALALFLVLASCVTVGKGRTRPGEVDLSEAGLSLSSNAQGESCRAEPRSLVEFETYNHEAFGVYCGAWEQPSATVVALPTQASSGETQGLLRKWIEGGIWRQSIDRRMTCKAGRSETIAGGAPAILMQCNLKKGGWPNVAVVAWKDERIFLGDGIPAAFPALESAIARLYDPEARAAAAQEGGGDSAAAAIERMEALLGGASTGGGANDIAAYQELSKLGQLYNSVGDYQGAENAYRRAFQIHESVLGANNPESAEVLMNLALEVSNQGRFDEAAGLFDRAEPLANASADRSDAARFLAYKAFDAANQREYGAAIEFARRATAKRIELFESSQENALSSGGAGLQGSGFGGVSSAASELDAANSLDITEIAQSKYVESAMLLRVGDFQDAEEAVLDAQKILGDSRRAPEWWEAQVENLHGQIAAALGRFDEAEDRIRRAIKIRTNLFGRTRPAALSWQSLGEVFLVQEKLDQALEAFRNMVEIISENDRGLIFEKLSPYLTALLRAGERQPARRTALFEEMFVASQVTREGTTAETIARTTARLATSDSRVGELMRELQEETAERDELQFLLGNEQSKAERDLAKEQELETKLTAARRGVQELEQQLQAAFPGYSQLVGSRPITVNEIAGVLRLDEALLSFSIGDVESFVFLVRQDGIHPARLDLKREDIDRIVAQLREPFEKAATGQLLRFDMQLSHDFYKALLGPVEEHLAGVRHLIVQPTGSLISFPFSLFVTKPPPSSLEAYDKADWLVADVATSLIPSTRAFVDLRKIGKIERAPKPFVGMANPTFTGEGSMADLASLCRQGNAPMPPELLRGLAPLPETANEVRSVALSFGATEQDVYTGSQATETTIRGLQLDQYRVVYFATHGLLPGELRCQSEPALALSPPAQRAQDSATDGLLDSSEIAELKLNADLVVLSACNTGGGGTGKAGGEALAGLARSFFFAGARTLMVSHWVVPSIAAVDLTTVMFRTLGGNEAMGPSAALQASQARMLKRPSLSHPVFWGPFTIIGDGGGAGATLSIPGASADLPGLSPGDGRFLNVSTMPAAGSVR